MSTLPLQSASLKIPPIALTHEDEMLVKIQVVADDGTVIHESFANTVSGNEFHFDQGIHVFPGSTVLLTGYTFTPHIHQIPPIALESGGEAG